MSVLDLPRCTNMCLAIHQLQQGIEGIEAFSELLIEAQKDSFDNFVAALCPHVLYLKEATEFVAEWNRENRPAARHNPDNAPAASAIVIFTLGNQAYEAKRLRFCNYFTLLAELDLYPHRAEFVRAFSNGGSEEGRRREASRLAESGWISAIDVMDGAYWAEDPEGKWVQPATPEIV